VTDEFTRYARPLIGDGLPDVVMEGGLQRFARFEMKPVSRKLPRYMPERHR
jgi:6-phosphofructokinase 1